MFGQRNIKSRFLKCHITFINTTPHEGCSRPPIIAHGYSLPLSAPHSCPRPRVLCFPKPCGRLARWSAAAVNTTTTTTNSSHSSHAPPPTPMPPPRLASNHALCLIPSSNREKGKRAWFTLRPHVSYTDSTLASNSRRVERCGRQAVWLRS